MTKAIVNCTGAWHLSLLACQAPRWACWGPVAVESTLTRVTSSCPCQSPACVLLLIQPSCIYCGGWLLGLGRKPPHMVGTGAVGGEVGRAGQGGPSLLSMSTEEAEAPEVEPRLVYCYPVRLAVSAPPMPSVEMHMENNVVCIRYKGEMVKVSRNYFSKLVRVGGRGGRSPQVGEARAGSFLSQSP